MATRNPSGGRPVPEGKLSAKAHQQAEKLAAKAEKLSAKAHQQADRLAATAATLERLASHLDAVDVWTRDEPGRRQARFTRGDIADAAMLVADAEGFEAVSMRRLATELDAGTMTLYHYVRTKDELLTLVMDAVMGEVLLPEDRPLPSDWRDALAAIARRTRDALLRHPWVFDIHDDPPIGPNAVRHFDQSLRALANLDADLRTKLDLISAIDEYVFGYCTHQRGQEHATTTDARVRAYVGELLETGEYPAIGAVVDDLGIDRMWSTVQRHAADPDRFDRNLERLLDGLEASVRR